MFHLEKLLAERNIKFDKILRHIRLVSPVVANYVTNIQSRCFPHVVNLACKAVLRAITNMDFAADDANDYEPSNMPSDPIATLRTLVRVVRSFFCRNIGA
jgi:hypothetical protein